MEALGIVIIILSAPGIIFFIFIWIFIQYTRLFNKEKYINERYGGLQGGWDHWKAFGWY